MSPSADAAGAFVTTPNACPAGLTLRSAAGLVPSGPGLGVGAGVISGKSPAAFPAPTKVVLTFGMGPGTAAAWIALRRPAAPPGPMSESVALFGLGGGPGGVTPPEPVELAVGVGLEDAEGVGLADAEGVGLEDAEGVGLAVGAEDVEASELVLGVGAGDVESVGLGVGVGGGDVEGAVLSLVVGAGVDGDGLGVSEGPGVTLAAAGRRKARRQRRSRARDLASWLTARRRGNLQSPGRLPLHGGARQTSEPPLDLFLSPRTGNKGPEGMRSSGRMVSPQR
jgi:hypothetical protein